LFFYYINFIQTVFYRIHRLEEESRQFRIKAEEATKENATLKEQIDSLQKQLNELNQQQIKNITLSSSASVSNVSNSTNHVSAKPKGATPVTPTPKSKTLMKSTATTGLFSSISLCFLMVSDNNNNQLK
jgi:hypothetical protein